MNYNIQHNEWQVTFVFKSPKKLTQNMNKQTQHSQVVAGCQWCENLQLQLAMISKIKHLSHNSPWPVFGGLGPV